MPGAPTITNAYDSEQLEWLPPASNGGSPIVNYRIYLNGELVDTLAGNETIWLGGVYYGDVFEVSAVNAVGEGPKSPAVVVA